MTEKAENTLREQEIFQLEKSVIEAFNQSEEKFNAVFNDLAERLGVAEKEKVRQEVAKSLTRGSQMAWNLKLLGLRAALRGNIPKENEIVYTDPMTQTSQSPDPAPTTAQKQSLSPEIQATNEGNVEKNIEAEREKERSYILSILAAVKPPIVNNYYYNSAPPAGATGEKGPDVVVSDPHASGKKTKPSEPVTPTPKEPSHGNTHEQQIQNAQGAAHTQKPSLLRRAWNNKWWLLHKTFLPDAWLKESSGSGGHTHEGGHH